MSEWWELGKLKIKDLSINYRSSRSREQRSQRAMLVCLSEHLKSKVDLGRRSSLGPYCSTLSEVANFDLVADHGGQVQSRVNWIEEGDICLLLLS